MTYKKFTPNYSMLIVITSFIIATLLLNFADITSSKYYANNANNAINANSATKVEAGIQANPQAITKSSPQASAQATKIVLWIDNPSMQVDSILKAIDPGKNTRPIIEDNRTLMPIRALIESCGGTVDWFEDEKKISIKFRKKDISLWIDQQKVLLNNRQLEMEVAPQLIDGRTFIPLRFVLEYFGMNIDWNENERKITISLGPLKLADAAKRVR